MTSRPNCSGQQLIEVSAVVVLPNLRLIAPGTPTPLFSPQWSFHGCPVAHGVCSPESLTREKIPMLPPPAVICPEWLISSQLFLCLAANKGCPSTMVHMTEGAISSPSCCLMQSRARGGRLNVMRGRAVLKGRWRGGLPPPLLTLQTNGPPSAPLLPSLPRDHGCADPPLERADLRCALLPKCCSLNTCTSVYQTTLCRRSNT